MTKLRYRTVIGMLALLTVVTFTVGVGWGTVSISPAQVGAVFLNKLGIATSVEVSTLQSTVLWSIRLPRVLMALVVGSALAVSGTALQGVFRNPLAEPSLLGISGGAVVFAMLAAIVRFHIGTGVIGAWFVPLGGFIGAFVVSVGLYAFFQRSPRRDITWFVLAGVITNVILGAIIALLPMAFRGSGLGSDTTFWTLGGLNGILWPSVYITAPVSVAAALLLWRMAPKLNLMALGDTEAEHLGVETTTVRLQTIVLVALVTGSAVAFVGVIAFVGLIVPHALRLIIGPDHRRLVPASALGGAVMVAAADTMARTVISPSELPVGILTTLIGGPLFFWLMYRERTRGGWL